MRLTYFFVALLGMSVVGVGFGWFVSQPSRSTLSPSTPIFSLPENQRWTLLVTGDVIPSRVVNQKMVAANNFTWPLFHIAPILQRADITLANLESPLFSSCPITNEGFRFCGDVRFVLAMKNAGIDIVNLANNHTLNYGWEGLGETKEHLKDNAIAWTGFDHDVQSSIVTTLPIHEYTVGFLGYNAVGQRLAEDIISSQIQELEKTVDVTVVSVHWGKEYERQPIPDASLAPDDPRVWGKKFIDWGADVVVGNHPHWYQGVEWYQGKPIFYALGNTVFDQEWSRETKQGFLAKLTFNGTRITPHDIEYFPIGIRDFGQAYMLEGKEMEEVLDFLVK